MSRAEGEGERESSSRLAAERRARSRAGSQGLEIMT